MITKNKVWNIQGLKNLELKKASFYKYTSSSHFHDEYSIGVYLKGSMVKFYRRSVYIIPGGAICILNPGEVHHVETIDQNKWNYRMLYPDSSVVNQIASMINCKEQVTPYFPDLVIYDKELFNMIINLHHTLEYPNISLLEKESKFIMVMEQLILKYAVYKKNIYSIKISNKHINIVKDYLDENFNQDVSLEVLAQLTDLSPYYLLRLFKKQVGITPHLYLTLRRINRAKQYLNLGNSLSEVAHMTGFVDQSHFTHRFKNIVGVTPGQYYSTIK